MYLFLFIYKVTLNKSFVMKMTPNGCNKYFRGFLQP